MEIVRYCVYLAFAYLCLAQRNGKRLSCDKLTRFLLYDVNPGEGFNLRRDVYIRMANLVWLLNKSQQWMLVLPPWNRMYHWNSDITQENIPWALFFDIDSLDQHIPVIEFKDFLKVNNQVSEIIYFQHFKEGWKDDGWIEKLDVRKCMDKVPFYEDNKGIWHWYLPNITALSFKCMSVQAEYSFLKEFLLWNTTSKSIYFSRAEHVMHGKYSEWSREFWTARRSVRFSKNLTRLADEFREKFLESHDIKDKTVLEKHWKNTKTEHGNAIGGPFIGVHIRRGDFIFSHRKDIPSILGAAIQINKALMNLNLSKVFVATDALTEEFQQLSKQIHSNEVHRYIPTEEILLNYMDGGIAIIDQWICAHARFFIGTASSTFTYRIHEEREILGFSQESTYNSFCPDEKQNCEQPTKWPIVYT